MSAQPRLDLVLCAWSNRIEFSVYPCVPFDSWAWSLAVRREISLTLRFSKWLLLGIENFVTVTAYSWCAPINSPELQLHSWSPMSTKSENILNSFINLCIHFYKLF